MRLPYAALAMAGLLLAFASGAQAQFASRPVPNRGVESYSFQSPSMGVRYFVNVGLPRGYKAGDGKRYPALIVTDGDSTFTRVNEAAASLGGTNVVRGLRSLYPANQAAGRATGHPGPRRGRR